MNQRQKAKLGFCSSVLTVVFPFCLAAVDLSSDYVIVAPSAAEGGVAPHVAAMAGTLSRTIAEATGWTLPVVQSAKPGRKAIRLGRAEAEKAGLFPKEPLHGFDFVIAEKGGDVYLFGADRAVEAGPKPGWFACLLPTVKAATTFLETYVGVRYFAPGAVGTDIPKVEKITVPDRLYKLTRPHIDAGTGRLFDMTYSIANNIFGNGAYHTFGGHTYPKAVPPEKYFKTHPEYYAVRGGVRKADPVNPALCISNPEVKKLIVRKLVECYDAGADIVELGQNDGGAFCECDKCRVLYGLGPKDTGEKLWRFHAGIAAEVAKLRPGKTVQILNYGKTRLPPTTFTKFPENVMIEMTDTTPAAFERWSKYSVPRGFTAYIYLWGQWPQPGCTAKHSFRAVADAARLMVAKGVKSIYRCGYGELFGTEGPAYYVYNRLIADPTLDEQALVDEYCLRNFGEAAAKPMREFFDRLEKRLAAHDAFLAYGASPSNPADLVAYIYTPETVQVLEERLARAEKAKLTKKQALRLKLVRTEFDYAKATAAVCHLYNASKLAPSAASVAALSQALIRRNEIIDGLTGPDGKMKALEGWPEVKVFLGFSKPVVKDNGLITARLGAPFNWDVSSLSNGSLPGAVRRRLVVKRAKGPVTLTPGFKTGAWEDANGGDLNGIQLEKVTVGARFKALYDDRNLYLGLTSTLSDAIKFQPLGHDNGAFRKHCFELFVDPWGTREKHFHFTWNPIADSSDEEALGLITDKLDPKYNKPDIGWNGSWTYENVRQNGVWYSLVTVPFATLGVKAPAPGEVYAVNVGRETPPAAGGELLLWSPNFANREFADMEAFGDFVFE